MAAHVPHRKEDTDRLRNNGGQRRSGGIHTEHPDKQEVKHNIDHAGNGYKQEGRAGISDSPKYSADSIISGNKHHAAGADADIAHRLWYSGFRHIHESGCLGRQRHHYQRHSYRHKRE